MTSTPEITGCPALAVKRISSDPSTSTPVNSRTSGRNAYLSTRRIESLDEIRLSPLVEVQQMLIADKVQNRKDFDLHHKGSHRRSEELERYFRNWLERLGVSEAEYRKLSSLIHR